jgi:hypothetical protein
MWLYVVVLDQISYTIQLDQLLDVNRCKYSENSYIDFSQHKQKYILALSTRVTNLRQVLRIVKWGDFLLLYINFQ